MMTDLPKFICIGAQRAGTTWLHECLNEHPDVYVPPEKELHFFDRFYDSGLSEYQNYFALAKRGDAKVWGEITPNYYQEPLSLERIKQDVPDVKIIYIIREPKSRAFSQYQLYALTHFSGLSFQEVINTRKSVIDLSLQGKHLQRTLSLFERKNVLVLLYDDLVNDPKGLLKMVFDFIDVDTNYVPKMLDKRINRVVLPDLQEKLKKYKLAWLIELVKASPLSEWIKEIAHRKSDKSGQTEYPSELRGKFTEDIRLIEDILDKKLDHWHKG
jgi:hypothetical protein